MDSESRGLSWDCPLYWDLNDPEQRRQFVMWARVRAFGDDYFANRMDATFEDDVTYWTDDARFAEMMAYGADLGFAHPEVYYYQRLIGRAARPPWIARFGPYANRLNDHESRTK